MLHDADFYKISQSIHSCSVCDLALSVNKFNPHQSVLIFYFNPDIIKNHKDYDI